MKEEGYAEHWISYGNPYFAAKELTVLPGRTVTIRDACAYGLIVLQGHGTLGGDSPLRSAVLSGSSQGGRPIETPALIRFGQLTYDEYFVSYPAARGGVKIANPSKSDPIVMLKHFALNPESPQA
jgi:hypothetical protein